MALSIVSNQAASIATRSLEQSNNAATATAEKLSSGKRINSAKDDAAASAIAARLSAEVAGLQQASVNAGQASSMLQIADGAFQNVEDILTRAKSLSVQAGSEQISDSERAFLDQEFSALKDEIDRIAKDTEFNGTKLVNGEVKADGITGTSLNGVVTNMGGTATVTALSNAFGASGDELRGLNVQGFNLLSGQSVATSGGNASMAVTMADLATLQYNTGNMTFMLTANVATIDGNTDTTVMLAGTVTNNIVDTAAMTVTRATAIELNITMNSAMNSLNGGASVLLGPGFDTMTGTPGGANNVLLTGADSKDFTFKVGTGTQNAEDEISVEIGGISTGALGIDGVNLLTKDSADSASDAVSTAIDNLQAKRSEVGAAQNRLDFAGQNVELTRENQEAARSELEDLNVAKAITEFSQQQLLVQAGTSTLSQANQLPQNLLQLFR